MDRMTEQEREKYREFLLTELKKMDDQAQRSERIAVE
jgi:hypothetical protein